MVMMVMVAQTLGVDWWFGKLSKYQNVRNKMEMVADHTDELVEIELKRFHAEEQRLERMKKLQEEIRTEASQVRKTILQARYFMDEIAIEDESKISGGQQQQQQKQKPKISAAASSSALQRASAPAKSQSSRLV